MSIPGTSSRRLAAVGVLAATAMVTSLAGTPVAAAPATGQIRNAGGATAVPDSYIVVLKDRVAGGQAGARQDEVRRTAAGLAARYGGKIDHVYGAALDGFEARLPEQAARRLAADPAVAYVEQNHRVSLTGTQMSITATQTNPPWGLDRTDQRVLPLNNQYGYTSDGTGVNVYVINTGIRITHAEFAGRAEHGYDFVDGALPADDCNGHGTHVAGIIGGSTYGVAKDARLIAVRVGDCGGYTTYARLITGIDWMVDDHDLGERAVAHLGFLGSGGVTSLNDALTRAYYDGVTVVVPAGDANTNACSAPGSNNAVVKVGATQSNDARWPLSNYGSCLDLFAPGVSIPSAWYTTDTAVASHKSTSMAAAHAAGVAVRVLERYPTYTPSQVANYLIYNATPGVVTNSGGGSPNLLLYLDPFI